MESITCVRPARRRRSEAEGCDVGRALSILSLEYNGVGLFAEPTDTPFRFRYTVAGDDDVTFRSSTFLGSLRGTAQPQGEYIVSWIGQGDGVHDIGNSETRLRPGVPTMLPTGRRFAFHLRDYRQNLIHFNAAFVERIAAERDGCEARPLHFDHTFVPAPPALSRWKAAVTCAADTLLRDGVEDLVRAEANRRVVEALLETFPHQPSAHGDRHARTSTARLTAALEFIDEQADQAITTTVIAEAAGLSVRTLQTTFQSQLGMTPTEYLHTVRLDRARAELLTATPEGTTVSSTARSWGFAHAGRFAAAYRQRFGEYPAETLAR